MALPSVREALKHKDVKPTRGLSHSGNAGHPHCMRSRTDVLRRSARKCLAFPTATLKRFSPIQAKSKSINNRAILPHCMKIAKDAESGYAVSLGLLLLLL